MTDEPAEALLAWALAATDTGFATVAGGLALVSSSSGPRSRTREGNKARGPWARERAAVVIPAGIAGLTWLFGIAMEAQL